MSEILWWAALFFVGNCLFVIWYEIDNDGPWKFWPMLGHAVSLSTVYAVFGIVASPLGYVIPIMVPLFWLLGI